jgi:hypothetical protein
MPQVTIPALFAKLVDAVEANLRSRAILPTNRPSESGTCYIGLTAQREALRAKSSSEPARRSRLPDVSRGKPKTESDPLQPLQSNALRD